jgi:hypothetical protein
LSQFAYFTTKDKLINCWMVLRHVGVEGADGSALSPEEGWKDKGCRNNPFKGKRLDTEK